VGVSRVVGVEELEQLEGPREIPEDNRQGAVEIMVVSNADVTAEKSLEQHLFAKTHLFARIG